MIFGYIKSPHSWIRFGEKKIMVDYEFIPHTGTWENPWGIISSVESYYVYKGQRVPHGQRIAFNKGGTLSADFFVDGQCVGGSNKGVKDNIPEDVSKTPEHQ